MTNTAHLRAEAIRLAGEGKTIKEIADQMEVPRITVFSWVPRAEESAQFQEMAAMRAEGMTNIQIAEALGTTRHRVGAILGPTARRGRRPEQRRRIVARLSEGNLDRLTDEAQRLGIYGVAGGEPSRMATLILEEIGAGRLEVNWKNGHNAFSHLVDARKNDGDE